MINTPEHRRLLRVPLFIVFIITLGVLPGLGPMEPTQSHAQSSDWGTPIRLSEDIASAWFPYVAVDYAGGVHIIWDGVHRSAAGEFLRHLLHYTTQGVDTWSRPNDVVVSDDIIRAALASDNAGKLHMVYRDHQWLYYKQAPVDAAWSAATWTSPRVISDPDSYLPDIAIDSHGTIHIVWTNSGELCPVCFPVFYRRSTDGGRTWSHTRVLSVSPAWRFRLQMEVGLEDNLYVLWDEVNDNGDLVSSTYVLSSDGGESWSTPIHFASPLGGSRQATMSVDGWGNVVAVWRTDQDDHIYYQLSSDGGSSWSAPSIIDGILARSRLYYASKYDKYDMAPDGGGNLHLVVVGQTSESEDPEEPPGLYHLEWDGTSWSRPRLVFAEPDLFPEYPSIAVGEGNSLHTVWFARDRENFWDSPRGLYEVWYSSARSSAPHVTAQSASLASPTPRPTPTVMPMSTESSGVEEPTPESTSGRVRDWQSVSMYPLGIAIVPVALLLLGLVIGRSWRVFR